MESREGFDTFPQFISQSSTGSKGKRIFSDDGGQGSIGQILWLLVVGQEMSVNGGHCPQGLGDARGGFAPGMVTVEQKKDARSLGEPGELVLE